MADDSTMNAVLYGDMAVFSHLIGRLMSPSNEERGQAELVYNECKKHPDILLVKLVQLVHFAEQQDLRGISAILLRKVISKDKLWTSLSPASQTSIKAQLLECVQGEPDRSIGKKLCDTVAELATGILEESQWPELLPFMFQWVSNPSDILKERALLIFGELAQYITASLMHNLDTILSVFQHCLAPEVSHDVQIAALRASANFIQSLETPQERDKFQKLLPSMLQTLTISLNSQEESIAQDALEMFIEVAGVHPRFLRKQLHEIVSTMLQIAEAKGLEDATRQLALEFLITLVDAREQAPGMMRKVPQFMDRIFAVLLDMLLDLEDEPSWYEATDDDEDVGAGSNYEAAQEYLDRAAVSLQGNTVLPVASKLLPAYVSDSDWKKRHAALIAISQIAEGCAKVMLKSLASVVNMVLGSMNDPHPRVRWAAINALGQLCTDLGPDLETNHHQTVVPSLLQAMDDFHNPRVQAHAAAAILNFSESATPQLLAPYLDAVVGKLLVLLQSPSRLVQEGAVTALAAVADCSQEQFQSYYDQVMPYLKKILIDCHAKEQRILRSKSLECISLVGMAVGKEKFGADAKQVMEVLVGLQAGEPEEDDPTISYRLQAWARLCKCLGQEFLPYMHLVMPPLMRSASLKPDVTIRDADSDDEDVEEDDDCVETITVGGKRIGIRTSVLEEKATACVMLGCYVDELKEGFFPWIEEVAQLMVPLLKFYFHEDVRKAACTVMGFWGISGKTALPQLLRAGKLAVEKGQAQGRDQSYVKQLLDFVVPPLVEVLHKEPEVEICAEMLESLNECIQIAGQLLSEGQVKSIVTQVKLVMEASRSRRVERGERRHTEDFDEEEKEFLEEENEQEDSVFEQVGEVLGSLIKTFKETFVPFFDDFLGLLLPLMQKDATPGERRIAICIFDDVAEHFGNAALKYYEPFLPAMLEACTDEHPDVRQAAVYGIGVCAQYGGPTFRPLVSESLRRLSSLVAHPSCRSSDDEMATDNAISAIGKMCEFQADSFDVSQVLPTWLSYLPVKGDLMEAKLVHQQLCRMVESSDQRLLGSNLENLPKVVSVIVDVLSGGSDYATDETAERMKWLLRRLDPAAQKAIWATLQPQQQSFLGSILETGSST